MEKLRIENINIADLKPYQNNSRVHTDAQIESLQRSIREFGIVKPIIIDESNVILAGHGIFFAAKANEYESLPCIRISYLSEEQKKAYIITDNKLSDLSFFDMNTVISELSTLDEADFDTSVTGFDICDLLSDDLSSIDSFFADKTNDIDSSAADNNQSKSICCPFCGKEFEP